VLRHRDGRRVREADAVATALKEYDAPANLAISRSQSKRAICQIPTTVDERFASFLGYLVGDGHVSRIKRHVGLTSGDDEQAQTFAELSRTLFDIEPTIRRDGNRWRVLLHSQTLSDFLVEHVKLTHGPSARQKSIPACILRS